MLLNESLKASMTIWGIVIEKATVLHWLFAAVVGALVRPFYAWIGSKFKKENFHLRAEVIGRQTVVETFEDMPFALTDKSGARIDNVYVIAVRFWNQGKRPLLAEHVSKDAPLRIRFEKDVRILATSTARGEEMQIFSQLWQRLIQPAARKRARRSEPRIIKTMSVVEDDVQTHF
jgi:hypothetical protein